MIIKLKKIIHCSSEHPDFPASNLLHNPAPGPWACAKPGELLATVTFELLEPTSIIGLDISNFRSCIVIVTGSTSADPDNWVPLVNHQFMTHDEATNNKFKDQVQLFTKKELNFDTLKMKFARVKVTCMQSANLKELFGLSFFILRTEVVIDMGIDVFGRFKLKDNEVKKAKSDFKDKYLRLFPEKQKSFKEDLVEKIKEAAASKFDKRQEEERTPKRRSLLEKCDEVFGKKITNNNSSDIAGSSATNGKLNDVVRTPFGDVVSSSDSKKKIAQPSKNIMQNQNSKNKNKKTPTNRKLKRKSIDDESDDDDDGDNDHDDEKVVSNNIKCNKCLRDAQDKICKICKKLPTPIPNKNLPPPKKLKAVAATSKKQFSEMLMDVTFSLSGYVHPQRDEIRRKGLKMGARYIANPNTTTNKCTHLICAFKNTPKFQQLQGHTKIVSHRFIEECYDNKKRYPWRRYALVKAEKNQPESEEEIECTTSPRRGDANVALNPFEQDTDSDTDY